MPRTFKVKMSETCTYEVTVEIPDDVTDDNLEYVIDQEAEEAFVQGHANFIASEDRMVSGYIEEIANAS